ncbi:MAG: biopolymer transporter ExbD [Phycisphaerales bacterium]|nr:biopolymer transporter ExbD [Phycisphaerae bacterium]NNF43734.1 biopolymer transporter ExbD [Phycisphaerales bacterium]NNM27556.1 biopolymer transporter ExbD [Phycisphaerales bacterium]
MSDDPRSVEQDANGDTVIEHRTARQRRGRARPRIALNLTAMIDVTFLLLVYFMVATEFKLGEEVYRLDLPDRRAAQAARDPFELDEEPLRIQIATLGRQGYRLRIDGPYPQPETFDDLHEFLRSRRIADEVPGGLFEPSHPIIIEPTRTTRWQHAMETFNAAARARFTNVTLGRAG